jgi:Primase C terminal 2 (PriCT-2)
MLSVICNSKPKELQVMTIHNNTPNHDAAIAIILAGAASDASPEAELAAAGTILHFEFKSGDWQRKCPNCGGVMWLADTESDGIICIGLSYGRPTCSDVPRVNKWLRDLGYQNPARHNAALAEMMRQDAGKFISQDPADRFDDDDAVDPLKICCALNVIDGTVPIMDRYGVYLRGYHIWLNTGAALYAGLGDDGLELWTEWCRTTPRFHKREHECVSKWRECKKLTGIGIGTLFHFADKHNRDWRNFYRQQLDNEETTA